MSTLKNITPLLARGDWSAAENALLEAASQRGATAGVFYNLARVLEAQGKDNEMILWLRKAVAVDPNHSMAWYELGRAQMAHDPQAAEKSFTKAAKLSPGDQDCWRHLARLRMRLADWEGCAAALQELPEDTETLSIAYRVACETTNAASPLHSPVAQRPANEPRLPTPFAQRRH